MLQQLHIHNYAIIDSLEIKFSNHLNIITGETGAGKSILMGALNLILGERADTSVLLDKEKKCFIEGLFKTNYSVVKEFLIKNDLDCEPEMLIRREISANGKSRAFINDTPVTLTQLKQLSQLLVDLHQQFDTLELGESGFQREVIDALSLLGELLQNYQINFEAWQAAVSKLEALQKQKNDFDREADYQKFQLDELSEAGFRENELEELDAELKILSNAEGIKSMLAGISRELVQGEQPIVPQLRQLYHQLRGYAGIRMDISLLMERLESVQIELQDIAGETQNLNDRIQFDEKRIEFINERISLGYKLLKKHGVHSTGELLEIKASLESRLGEVLQIDNAIRSAATRVDALFQQVMAAAGEISVRRKKTAPLLAEKVNQLLIQVGMPNARIKVSVSDAPLNFYGKDLIEFLFDGNKTNRFEPLRKVASGGELSRLMLCIKSLVAESVDLSTMIFDEIDAGISGEAAKQVGIIMKGLAVSRQVIAITHQPQIAGKANAHFFVFKEIRDNRVTTNIRLLNQEERISVIAQMLSGERPTAAALQNAREMVMN